LLLKYTTRNGSVFSQANLLVNVPKLTKGNIMANVKDFFIYSTGRIAIAPAAAISANIAIQADSDFELLKLAFSCDVAGAAITNNTYPIPNATLLITDSGSGRQLSNIAVPIEAFIGVGKEPFILPMPRIFSARSNIQLTLTSFEAANTDNISINLIGNKIFSYN
jgi:hypothetical protein